jgi:hypothetical protein
MTFRSHRERPWIEVASRPDGFALVERFTSGATPWRNLKVIKTGNRPARQKGNWWIAWNGERFSRTTDARLLAEHYPAVAAWVVEVLKASNKRQGESTTP